MTYKELKEEISNLEKNPCVNDNTEIVTEDFYGHLIELHNLYAFISPNG